MSPTSHYLSCAGRELHLTEWGAPPPEQVISHTNLYWQFQSAPGRTAATSPTAEVEFG